MTTIAFDGKSIAADSCVHGPHVLQQPYTKLHDVGEYYIGGAGVIGAIGQWIDWFTSNDPYPFTPTDEPLFEGIFVVHKKTFLLDVYDFGAPLPTLVGLNSPYACGSGGAYAMGAMLAGKSAEQAVRIAAKLDPFTNDDIQVVLRKQKRSVRPFGVPR